MAQPRVLIIADVPCWVFEKHARSIKERLSHKYRISVGYFSRLFELELKKYDVVYLMDSLTEEVEKFSPYKKKMIIGVRGEFYYPKDEIGLFGFYKKRIESRASCFHVVNTRQYFQFESIAKIPLMLVPHGVDTKYYSGSMNSPNLILTVGTAGASYSGGKKGFELVSEACEISKLPLRVVSNIKNKGQMKAFYNSIDLYCCMSESEGQNNCIMEAGAMGVPVISTKTGAAPEMIKEGVSGYLIDRTVEALVSRFEELKCRREQRKVMGKHFQEEIRRNWSWDVRIKGFEFMFDRVLNGV